MFQGLTDKEILTRHAKCPPLGKRKPKSQNPKPETWKPTAEIYAKPAMAFEGERSPGH